MDDLKVKTLYLGLTDYCNLSCIMCPQNTPEMSGKKKGFMSVEMIDSILHSMKSIGSKQLHVFLMWVGESTLHPEFDRIIEKISQLQKPVSKFVIYTNGTDCESIRNLVKSLNTPVQVTVSIDAASAETYRTIKQSTSYMNLAGGIEQLLTTAGNCDSFELSLQFLVMKENYHEVLRFRDFWSDMFREKQIPFGIVSDYNHEDYGRYNVNLVYRRTTIDEMEFSNKLYLKALDQLGIGPVKRYTRTPGAETRKICSAPFRNITVDWNGDVTFCCYDTFCKLGLGNLCRTTLEDIWMGEKAESVRKAMLGTRKNMLPDICRCCDGFDAPELDEKEKETVRNKYG